MLAKDVGRIDLARNVHIIIRTGGNGFTEVVPREHQMMLIQTSMGYSHTFNNRFIIPKIEGPSIGTPR